MTTGTAASDLLVCAAPPDAGSRTAMIARALTEHGRVDLLHLGAGGAPIEGVTLHPVKPARRARRRLAYTRARALGIPAAFAREAAPDLTAAAVRLAGAPGRRRVIADGPVAAAALLSLARTQRVVYLAHAVGMLLDDRATAAERLELRSFERGLLGGSAETWVERRAQADKAAEIAPGVRVRVLPDAVDVDAIPIAALGGFPPTALLAGDFTSEPARVGLRFVADEVMPAIWPAHPDVRLLVAGPGAPDVELQAADERIVVVAGGDDAHADARCLLLPELDGPPQPRRFVLALARGLPIVATPRAVQGVDAIAGLHYLEAFPSRPDFAIAIVEALKGDAGPGIGAAGRTLAEDVYSLHALAARLAPHATFGA